VIKKFIPWFRKDKKTLETLLIEYGNSTFNCGCYDFEQESSSLEEFNRLCDIAEIKKLAVLRYVR
jgi:hypothetical protein